MKATIVTSDDRVNLEIPLTLPEFEKFKARTPKYSKPEEFAEALILEEDKVGDSLELNDELIARIKRDITTSYLEHAASKDATFIIGEVSKLVNYCIIK